MILTIQGTPDLFLDLEPEVTETAAAGLPLRGSQMDATIRDSDGSGKCDLFLSFSPSVSYRQHPSEVHARAAYEAKNFIGWARLALTYPPKLQKRPIYDRILPEMAHNQIVCFLCYVFLWDSSPATDLFKRALSFVKRKNSSYGDMFPFNHKTFGCIHAFSPVSDRLQAVVGT